MAAATRPSSTLGYPYHDSCLRCHRQEFYRGNFPVICTVCHTRVAPRLTARDVYPQFPGPKHRDLTARELPAYFPHGLHQNLLALDRPERLRDASAGVRLLRTSFGGAVPDQIPTQALDCATCHATDERGPLALPLKGIQSDETFKRVEADTFETIPGTREADAHASCFNCHWQAQKPTREDCNGCHLTRTDYTAGKLQTYRPPALMPTAARWFKDWPTELPMRLSLKFRHNTHTPSADGKTETNNHDIKCTTCHVHITQLMPLDNPKTDVQIITCASCHASPTAGRGIPVGQGVKVTIYEEMKLKEEPGKKYTCVACHTSVIGVEQPPCTHYAVIGEPCSEVPATR